MESDQLSPELSGLIADVAQQIVRAVLQDHPLVQALYDCQQPEKQPWMQALPKDAHLWIRGAMREIMDRSRDIERHLAREAGHLAQSMDGELRSLRYRGFSLEGTQLTYNDQQWRLNRCHEAISHVFSCLYNTTPNDVIERLVKVSQREEFRDIFLLAIHQHRPFLVRKYKVAWFKRMEAAIVTAESATIPRLA